MTPIKQFVDYLPRRINPLILKQISAALLAVLVIFAQVLPASATHTTSGSGSWIEICGDGGTYLAQIDESGESKIPDCQHCTLCLVPANDTPLADLTDISRHGPVVVDSSFVVADAGTLPVRPEQYWSASRGPPIQNVENNMISTTTLSVKDIAGMMVNTWGTPCV